MVGLKTNKQTNKQKQNKTKQKKNQKTKNGHIRQNLTQNGEPQRNSWGTQKKKKKDPYFTASLA